MLATSVAGGLNPHGCWQRGWLRDRANEALRVGGARGSHQFPPPNQVVRASRNPVSVPSPTQATYPSGRITMATGALTEHRTGSSHGPPYSASISWTRSVQGVMSRTRG